MDAKIERRGVLGSSLLNRLAQLGLFFFRKRADAAARQAVAGTQVEFRSLQHPLSALRGLCAGQAAAKQDVLNALSKAVANSCTRLSACRS